MFWVTIYPESSWIRRQVGCIVSGADDTRRYSRVPNLDAVRSDDGKEWRRCDVDP
jgi:hypothetical protein